MQTSASDGQWGYRGVI